MTSHNRNISLWRLKFSSLITFLSISIIKKLNALLLAQCDSIVNLRIFSCTFQLENTKSQDGKQTLLHFLVNTIESKYPEVLEFSDEMLHVEQAARGMIVSYITRPTS